jgi:FimV-like protein
MKHSEKEHLKENELAHVLVAANESFGQNRSQVLAIGGGILALLVAVGGYVTWQRNKDATVSGLLAEAMVVYEAPVQAPAPPGMEGGTGVPAQAPGTYPTEKAKYEAALPKFMAAADSAPSSTPGRLARMNAAAVLLALGRFDEARTQYEQLASGSDLIARGAAMGKAQAQVRAGQFDPAIESLKTLSTQPTSGLPVDGVLMELARAYRGAGKTDDARKTLNEIVEKHAESPFAAEARAELDKLKG